MKRFVGLAVAASLALGAAGGAAAQPPGQQEDQSQASLLLGALVGSYSPTLSAAQKTVLTGYIQGHDAKAGKITVTADQVSCTGGAKAETAFACDLKFGAHAVHLTARAASRVFAALELVGAGAGVFGPYSASASAISCTLDAAAIAQGSPGAAHCAFTPAPGGPGVGPDRVVTVDDDSSLLVAALVGSHTPTVSAADKAVLAHYLAGEPTLDAGAGKFAVNADDVDCLVSSVDWTAWSCGLTFGSKLVDLDAETSAELYADLALAGQSVAIGMGKSEIDAQTFACTVDPAAIAAQANGAACSLPLGQENDFSAWSLRLATLVGSYSPTLSAAQKAVLAGYQAGAMETNPDKITVTADQINCAAGPKDVTAFVCDLTFGANTVHLTARAASQVFAALQTAGGGQYALDFVKESAAVVAFSCTFDTAAIAAGAAFPDGIDCTFNPIGPTPIAVATATSPITVDDASSLLVGALVGGNSPTLGAADKAVLAHYLAGEPTLDAGAGKIAVGADKVLCTGGSNEVTWACDLTFGAQTVHLTAAAAAELAADLMLTGLQGEPDGTGVFKVGAKPVQCTFDPAAIAAQTNGAACTLTESD